MADIQVLGRLTRDPQQRPVNQQQVVQIDIAESRKEQGREITTYYSASFWNRAGEPILNNFHKGDPIYISGELVPREYQDRNGNNRTSLDIRFPHFRFVPAPPRNRGGYNNQPQQYNNGYQQGNRGYNNQPQGQSNNGYQQNNQQPQPNNQQPQQNNQQPQQNNNNSQNYAQQSLGTDRGGWENTGAGQKMAELNNQPQETSNEQLPFPTQENQETPF